MGHEQCSPAVEAPGQPVQAEPRPAAPVGSDLDELADRGRVVRVIGQQRRLALIVLAARVEPERDLRSMVGTYGVRVQRRLSALA